LNPLLYPLANSTAFHNGLSMGSDFAHVGLGSPSLGVLALALSGKTAGPVSATVSQVGGYAAPISFVPSGAGIPADGKTQAFVKVQLIDANDNSISGKTVTIAANGGSHAVASPSSAVTNATNGAALFTITDSTPESVTFSANDTSDGIALTQQATVPFVTPVATPTPLPTPTPTSTPIPTATPTPAPPATAFSGTAANINASPGQQITASFSATDSQTINSVTLGLSNPGVFSALSLSIGSQKINAASPPAASNTFTFNPPIPAAGTTSDLWESLLCPSL